MDPRLLVESLSGSAEHIRATRDALLAQGNAVGPVLQVLRDEQSPVDWTVSADILRGTGEPPPVADAASSASTPETTPGARPA
ncbi:hypothetical protein ACU686_35200 [Yinghuangia aomiensis]